LFLLAKKLRFFEKTRIVISKHDWGWMDNLYQINCIVSAGRFEKLLGLTSTVDWEAAMSFLRGLL